MYTTLNYQVIPNYPKLALALRLYVEHGRVETLPFPDHFVDILVASGSARLAEKEVMRVLTPLRGRALIDEQLVVSSALLGTDDWTHRLHGPDNNPVSADTAFQLPAMLQYLEMPMQTSFQGGMLAANGRRFELSDWATKKPDRNDVAGELRARNLYNGQLLWERKLPKKIEPDMQLCVADEQHVYLAADDGCRVLVIDAETGADVRTLSLIQASTQRVNWIAIDGGRMYALVGKELAVRKPLTFMGGANRKNREGQYESGQSLIVWDLQADRELWRHAEPTTIDYRTIAVRDGSVFFYSEKSRLVCLDREGKVQWENKDASWLAKLSRPNILANINTEATSTLIIGPQGQLRFAVPGRDESLIFDSSNGHLLWETKLGAPKCFFLDADYLTPLGKFDAATGNKVGDVHVAGSGCGILTWAPGLGGAINHVSFGVKSPCGVGAFVAGGMLNFSPSQCDCWPHLRGAAGFASGKQLFERARKHAEHPLVKGRTATSAVLKASYDEWPQYRRDVRRSGAAEVSVSRSAKLQQVASTESAFSVPAGHDMHRKEWLDRPTPPVTAGGLAYYGASDGSVHAVNVVDGKSAWTFWTGGSVFTSPAFADGRLYVGSGDGWVYCLDAATGELVWRWRGAPVDRRIMVYGKLTSVWPVTTVMVDNGAVYGVAGQWMQNGSVTFALDAFTGEPRWTKWTEPAYESESVLEREDFGFAPAGQLALVGNSLWVRTYVGVPTVFDTRTGQRAPLASEHLKLWKEYWWSMGFRTATSGQDILVLDDETVLQGGYPLLGNPDIRHDKSAAKFLAWLVDKSGTISAKPLPRWAIPHSQIAPSLSGDAVLLVGGVGTDGRSANSTIGLSLWSVERWRQEYAATGTTFVTGDEDDANPNSPKPIDSAERAARAAAIRLDKFTLDMQQATWRNNEIDVNAVVLCNDAAIAVLGERKSNDRTPTHAGFSGWKLTAFNRLDGKERWSVPLPGEPVFNGIAPASGGRWVLTLRNGNLVIVGE